MTYSTIEGVNKGTFLKKLGAQVAKTRKSKGYSQDRLYLEAGFSRGTVSKIENGLVDFLDDIFFNVKKAFD